MKALLRILLLACKPLIMILLLRHPEKLARWRSQTQGATLSGMVTKFNVWHRLFFAPFFRRVETVAEDVQRMKDLALQGPVVYVMKNRGQLEYRYFNQLFVREKIPLTRYANNVLTLLWWPAKIFWQIVITRIDWLYHPQNQPTSVNSLAEAISKHEHALVNLSISRDYLFGLIRTNPLETLLPLLAIQKKTETPIRIVPLQFLYTKTPENAGKTFLDFVFGERSNPGALRKFFLLINPRHRSLAKFGEALQLQEFLAEHAGQDDAHLARSLLARIREMMRIEQVRITGPALKPKERIVDEILADTLFQDRLAAHATLTKARLPQVRRQATKILREIAADVNYTVVEFIHVVLRWVWDHIFDGWVVNEEGLGKVRAAAGKNPVVLVPMHRSHIDYLLISYIFYARNITFPHVCAGINLNFWPAGALIRKGGGFFIRRSFSNDHLYKEAFYAYLKKLMTDSYCIEFFIEGTRSRTGKLLTPKMGVLSMMLRAWSEGACADVTFVPVAINYDQIPEQKAYQNESAGAGKSKENARELFKVRKALGRRYGKIYLEFGDPISLKDYFSTQGLTQLHADDLKKETAEFASHLTYNINRLAVVTPTSLVSLALLAGHHPSVTLDELLARIAVLRDYLEFKGAVFSDVLHFNPHWAIVEALRMLKTRGLVTEVHTFEGSFYAVEGARRIDLDYYKNNILHFFVSLASVMKILRDVPSGSSIAMDSMTKQYDTLKTLFRHDFIFSHRSPLREHIGRVVGYLASKGLLSQDAAGDTIVVLPEFHAGPLFTLAQGLLDNFLESQIIMLRYIRHTAFVDSERKMILKDILSKSQNIFLKGDLTHPEALSQFNLENALHVFTDIGLVKSGKEKSLYTVQHDPELISRWLATLDGLLHKTAPASPMAATAPHLSTVPRAGAAELH